MIPSPMVTNMFGLPCWPGQLPGIVPKNVGVNPVQGSGRGYRPGASSGSSKWCDDGVVPNGRGP